MPVIIEFSRCIYTYLSAKFEYLKDKIYRVIVKLLVDNREVLRSCVLEYLQFKETGINSRKYTVDLFSDSALNEFDFLRLLNSAEFLPTRNKDVFISPSSNGKRYPSVMGSIFKEGEDIGIALEKILDVGYEDRHFLTLNALGCYQEPFSSVLGILKNYTDKYIAEKGFRTKFYSFLKNGNMSKEDKEVLRTLQIIPVYARQKAETIYIKWIRDKIFTKPQATQSTELYYVLNETILPKGDCEKYLGVAVNEMSEKYEKTQYREALKERIENSKDLTKLYEYIMQECLSGMLRKYEAMDMLFGYKKDGKIPLKNMCGRITTDALFENPNPRSYFCDLIDELSVHEECRKFAKDLGCKELRKLDYDEIPYRLKRELDAEDIESFLDDYFKDDGIRILKAYFEDGFISDELVREYNLQFLDNSSPDEYEYDFPNEPVRNLKKLRRHISEKWATPSHIVKVIEQRTVSKVELNGKRSDLNSNEIRQRTIQRYSPDEGICFCQICRKPKKVRNIEVNNIERDPKYYWPELRVSLCLECSKWFEEVRGNERLYKRFLDDIKRVDFSGEEVVEIPIVDDSITFTQTHLAEIQEILKGMPQ